MVRLTTVLQLAAGLAASFLNFSLWYLVGHSRSHTLDCPSLRYHPRTTALSSTDHNVPYRFDLILSNQLMKYKEGRLVNIRYPTWSLLVQQKSLPSALDCDRMVNPFASAKRKYSCQAVMFAGTNMSYNMLRHEDNTKPRDQLRNGTFLPSLVNVEEPVNSTGFFGNVANDRGRRLQSEKMGALLNHLTDLETKVLTQLARHNLHPGDDLIVMVMNDGEMEMFANFVCSLRRHGLQDILARSLVFTSSADALPFLRAMGAIAIHHEGAFPTTSRHSSFEYLDPIFIEMMWYKSFSVWLMLKLRFHVLFMDVDIVFFQDPLRYFAAVDPDRQVDAFLSDDGQRSLRYSPFYANSGFYFLRPSDKTVYFAWSVLCAFDLLHITGSHQNIYTLRLLESLDFYYLRTFFLPMRAFPSGVKFSHDRPYMRAIRDGHERPVIFHMCWTRNKEHKLINFREAAMWYVRDDASEYLGRLGLAEGARREQQLARPAAYDADNTWTRLVGRLENENASLEERWRRFAPLVCTDGGS